MFTVEPMITPTSISEGGSEEQTSAWLDIENCYELLL
jgi:hypothetical protein